MKKRILYLIILTGVYSCSTQRTAKTEHIHIIQKNRPVWVESWVNNPLSDLKTDGWLPYNSEYSYVYSQIPEYELFYFYSPSQKLFVDIYSRTMEIDIKKNDTAIICLEPESEIILSDTVSKTSDRLLFVSDGACFEDVVWITDVCFIVLYYSTVESTVFPEILIFDTEKRQQLHYKGAGNQRRFDYLFRKFGNFSVNR